MAKLPLWPLRGFINSRPRQTIPLNAITSESKDWLVGRQRYRRRAGRTIFGDTITSGHETSGILEGKWGAKARRMESVALASQADGYPTPAILYTYEPNKFATLVWRSTNGTDSWRTIGKEFSATHYPDTGVPQHRVFPLIYRNEYGGLTVHRLTTAEYRSHMAAGARSLLAVRDQIAWAGDCPARWNGKWNDDTASGSEGCEVFPLGLIPPLQMPVCSAGTDLGTSTKGPWIGSNAFFFSVCFENEAGELSMFAIPRPPGSAWSGYAGFGYMQVDSANPTHYYDSVVYSFIPQGPPGTKYIHIMRSGAVDIAATGAGAVVQPAVDDLQFCARVPQGTTTYVDTNGNGLSLNPDPRIQEMFRGGGLRWAPAAQYLGRFDGHITAGGAMRPSPYAMIVAPWLNGDANLPIDNASLYGSTSYFVAVSGANLYLRSVTGGSSTDKTYSMAGLTLRQLVDRVNSDTTLTTTTLSSCTTQATVSGTAYSKSRYIFRASAFSGVYVGDTVVSSRFPTGTTVTNFYTVGGTYIAMVSNNATSDAPTLGAGGEDFDFVHNSAGVDIKWGAGVVPGADADESTDSLLRTFVVADGTWSSGSKVITLGTAAQSTYIVPGMCVKHTTGGTAWPDGTTVTEVTDSTHIKVSNNSVRSGTAETIDVGYDTGDTALALNLGFIRMFGNAFPAPIFWRLSYLDRFPEATQDTMFTAASPGYAQDGLNTWLVRNRRSGPAVLGPLMGFADLGPYELHFYAKGRMRLWNPRTGTTHNDEDYTKVMTSWTRGARSPYAICGGNGWAIFLSDDGLYVCSAAEGTDRLISLNIYDPAAQAGSRGELEYALGACVAASEAGTDDYKIAAQVIGSVLRVRYYKDASSTYFDREIRYDFSDSAGRDGISEVLMSNGDPYPWSAPLTLPVSCSALVTKADGVHHYAAINSNAGTADGRVDEIDTGTTDNGTLVMPVAYTGLHIPDDLNEIQPESAYVVSTKAGAGLEVELTRTPEVDPSLAEWDKLEIPTSGPDDFGRSVRHLQGAERLRRSAIGVKIYDDGTGTCPEVSEVLIKTTDVQSTTGNRRAGR